MTKKVILMILDGWGLSPQKEVSAVELANTPFIDSLYQNYPHAKLKTFGLNVGLPEGQMGNSEVGHINIGAGRIVYQDLAKINLDIRNDTLRDNKAIRKTIDYIKANPDKKIHLLGLLSDGGVHSHINHLKGLLDIFEAEGLEHIFVHAFTDGRDVDPKSGIDFIKDLQNFIKSKKSKLASVVGRYFAMDRDSRWERVKKTYDMLVHANGEFSENPIESISKKYKENITDEFLDPIVVTENNIPIATIEEKDVVIFFNFRTDRGRQLTNALTQNEFKDYQMNPLSLEFVTMTNYDQQFKGIDIVYEKPDLEDTLGETLSKQGKTQIRIAETEKYPHVTYFFNGGKETLFEGEQRLLCPSPKVATYDLKPEMSAGCIAEKTIKVIVEQHPDFVCLNFANPDMVGHTGDIKAAIKACETVDKHSKTIVETATKEGYSCLIIADHGNCDTMLNPDGSPNTAHTVNLVPIIAIDDDIKKIEDGVLGDVAPTILDIMELEKPKAMTQNSLITKK